MMHPDGQIEIKDRSKDIIISGGENFSSLEVEAVLQRHPDVLIAAVVAGPHPKWGETGWAFIETRDGRDVDLDGNDQFCRENPAGFKRPRGVTPGQLPKTAISKIQKFQLRETAKDLTTSGWKFMGGPEITLNVRSTAEPGNVTTQPARVSR